MPSHFASFQVIVLCVGTNNYDNTSEETYEGIMVIVSSIRERQPSASIVIVVCDNL